ncbi:MAG: HTH domain-containing protein [Thermotogae bacterium]|nr:HTH domain-containing protein [Thermotogota bacterium]
MLIFDRCFRYFIIDVHNNLRESREPVTGTELAQRVVVSRQTNIQLLHHFFVV